MSNTAMGQLSNKTMQQLLAAAGAESEQNARENLQALDYDWRRPCYFSRTQLTELKHFAENLAAQATAKFSRFFQCSFNVTTDSISQHFAQEFLRPNPDAKSPNNYLVFAAAPARPAQSKPDSAAKPQPCGLLTIPHQTALLWTTQSLGGAAPDSNPDRILSQLEISLLTDIAALFIDALSDSCRNQQFSPAGPVATGPFPLDLENTRELCKITFNTQKADRQNASNAFLLMPCDKLESAAGITKQTAQALSPDDAAKAIITYLHPVNVTVTARLGNGKLTFHELMNLDVNDILILDTTVDEPVKLAVQGIDILHGRLAKSAGNYAVAITRK